MSKRSPQYQKQRSTRRATRRARPIIIAGCEGETEANYIAAVAAERGLRVKKIIHNDPKILIEAVARETTTERQEGMRVLPIVIYDSEATDERTLTKIADSRKLAEKLGITIAVSFPYFERWVLMHFEHVSPHDSKAEISRRLTFVLSDKHWVAYSKPWSVANFRALATQSDTAVAHCSEQQHAPIAAVCLCKLVQILQKTGQS